MAFGFRQAAAQGRVSLAVLVRPPSDACADVARDGGGGGLAGRPRLELATDRRSRWVPTS